MSVERRDPNIVIADMGTSLKFGLFAFSSDIRIKDAAGNLVLMPGRTRILHSFTPDCNLAASGRAVSFFILLAFVALLLASCGGGGKFTPGQGSSNIAPVAVAQAAPETGDSPLTVTLVSNGSYDADGTIVKYQWDFEGDGKFDTSSAAPEPVTHEYPAGEYHAKLRVTDNGGKTATAETGLIFSNPAHLYWTFERVDGGPEAGYDAGLSPSIAFQPIKQRPAILYLAEQIPRIALLNADNEWVVNTCPFSYQAHTVSNLVIKDDGTAEFALITLDGLLIGLQLSSYTGWSELFKMFPADSNFSPLLRLHPSTETVGVYIGGDVDNGDIMYMSNGDEGWTSENTGFNRSAIEARPRDIAFEASQPKILLADRNICIIAKEPNSNWSINFAVKDPLWYYRSAIFRRGGSVDSILVIENGSSLIQEFAYIEGLWKQSYAVFQDFPTSTSAPNWLVQGQGEVGYIALIKGGYFGKKSTTFVAFKDNLVCRDDLGLFTAANYEDISLGLSNVGIAVIAYHDTESRSLVFGTRIQALTFN